MASNPPSDSSQPYIDYFNIDPSWTPPMASSWSPAALLDPRHNLPQRNSNATGSAGTETSSAAQGSFNPSRPPSSAGHTPQTTQNELAFHFMDAGTDDGYLSTGDVISRDLQGGGSGGRGVRGVDVGPSPAPSLPPSRAPSRPSTPLYVPDRVSTPTNGMVSMLERNFLLQDRRDVPEPKRRKVELDGAAPPKGSFAGGNGILANDVKEAALKARENATDSTRPAPPVSLPSGPMTVDLTDGSDVNTLKTRESYEEVCFGSVLNARVLCHITPAPKPGAEAVAGPAYWPSVKIVLKRVVGEQTSTIQVYDHTRSVFGVLEKRAADCLAPLMDVSRVHLRTDARIAQRRKQEDEVVGQPTKRAFTIELVLFGSGSFVRAVGVRLGKYGFKLVKPTHLADGIRLAIPEQAVARPAVMPPPVAAGYPQSTSSSSVANTPLRTMEELRSEVLSVFDSMANAEDLPEMEPCSDVRTPLLHHQKQGLYFMTNREKPLAEQANTKLSASIWQKKTLPGNGTAYYNVITNQMDTRPPSETLGGILADMMGLGKTLSILSLIATTKPLAEPWVKQHPVQPVAPEKKKRPDAPAHFDAPTRASLPLTQVKHNGRGTLLVCPLSTITNWEEQIKTHLAPDSLSFHIYHGPNRIKEAARLSEFDLVITTYGSVSSELTARSRGKKGGFPLEEIGWFRVVLDEAHMIREQATLQFKAICRLQASRRWAVTGTPVQNRLEDLGSLLAFLRLRPFDDRGKFTHHIVAPFRACDPNILPQLRILVDTITLRRLKDKIDLPKRTDRIVRLDFSTEESRLYSFFAQNAQDRLQVLTSTNERLPGGKTYIHILQAILRLRLICAHGRELLGEEDLKLMRGTTMESAIDLDDDEDDASDGAKGPPTEAAAYQLFDLMRNTDEDKCVSCKRKLGGGVVDDLAAVADNIRSEKEEDLVGYMTPCFHLYCPNCVKDFRDAERGLSYRSKQPGTCPVCQAHIVFSCTELRHDRADTEHDARPLRGRQTREADTDSQPQAGNAADSCVSFASSSAGGGSRSSGSGSGKSINEASYRGPHTKTKALVAELLKNKAESEKIQAAGAAPIKSVVFSGWTSHLDLIELALDHVGIRHCRLDGRMSRTARTQAMETFRTAPDVHVILVSIMAGGLGLNLTAGNHVYVMEPQYNPAAEAQAIDRVHRLGQTRPVHTVRYIMRDSIEESMLKIQEKKIKLANLSMERADRKNLTAAETSRQHLEDLRSLFR